MICRCMRLKSQNGKGARTVFILHHSSFQTTPWSNSFQIFLIPTVCGLLFSRPLVCEPCCFTVFIDEFYIQPVHSSKQY